MNPLPSRARLQELFTYDLVTGRLHWRECRYPRTNPAGYTNPSGYVQIGVDGCYYQLHRLNWMYIYGEDPGELELDHINRCPTDNRIENLRKVTHKENHANRTETHRNGGVFWRDDPAKIKQWAHDYHKQRSQDPEYVARRRLNTKLWRQRQNGTR